MSTPVESRNRTNGSFPGKMAKIGGVSFALASLLPWRRTFTLRSMLFLGQRPLQQSWRLSVLERQWLG